MRIDPPRLATAYHDRARDCQDALELQLAGILDGAANAGWTQTESLNAVEALITTFRKSYAEDPGPSEDPMTLQQVIDEEANDNNRYEREGE